MVDELDSQSRGFIAKMAESDALKSRRLPGARTVLVVLSARGMVFDVEALRQKIHLAYPEAAVFFQTTLGKPIGAPAPRKVDLLIDFTGPGQRQCLLAARGLRSRAKLAVGRNAGLFRKRLYDRVFDEKAASGFPTDLLTRERYAQREVLALAGVALVQAGDTPPDRGKSIALELPPLRKH
jgi:hypothetical protein